MSLSYWLEGLSNPRSSEFITFPDIFEDFFFMNPACMALFNENLWARLFPGTDWRSVALANYNLFDQNRLFPAEKVHQSRKRTQSVHPGTTGSLRNDDERWLTTIQSAYLMSKTNHFYIFFTSRKDFLHFAIFDCCPRWTNKMKWRPEKHFTNYVKWYLYPTSEQASFHIFIAQILF